MKAVIDSPSNSLGFFLALFEFCIRFPLSKDEWLVQKSRSVEQSPQIDAQTTGAQKRRGLPLLRRKRLFTWSEIKLIVSDPMIRFVQCFIGEWYCPKMWNKIFDKPNGISFRFIIGALHKPVSTRWRTPLQASRVFAKMHLYDMWAINVKVALIERAKQVSWLHKVEIDKITEQRP